MTEERLLQRFKDFENALMRLKEALAIEVTNEFTIAKWLWKFMKT
ncbi:MAG: hypothetical protein PWP75_280 [Caldanaerobacter sp.]|jgi:hypothetical protein|nr:hypothetical protein [Caldanaerobacter sp.]